MELIKLIIRFISSWIKTIVLFYVVASFFVWLAVPDTRAPQASLHRYRGASPTFWNVSVLICIMGLLATSRIIGATDEYYYIEEEEDAG